MGPFPGITGFLRHPAGLAALLAAIAAAIAPGRALGQADYAPSSRAWNGLSELTRVAEEAGITLETPTRVDVDALGPDDSLLLVHPRGELPRSALARFLKAGGRVAVADDFGDGDALLSIYGIERRAPGDTGAPRLRGNAALPVAEPRPDVRHPLTEEVDALVTNHPAVLHHPELRGLFGLGRAREPVVLAGAVDGGRLVAIGDPSALINNMLQFRGNRRFARNVLQYLDDGRGGRVVLAATRTPVVGRSGFDAGAPVERVRQWLADLADAEAPPLALRLGAMLLLALLVLVAVSSLPRKSPYGGAAMLPRTASSGGFLGRVGFFRDRPEHLLHPALVYKHELEGELVRRLGLQGRPLLKEVTAALRTRGVPEPEVQGLRQLLLELDWLRDRQDRPPSPPRVTEARFRRIVDTGETILGMLQEPSEQQARRRRRAGGAPA